MALQLRTDLFVFFAASLRGAAEYNEQQCRICRAPRYLGNKHPDINKTSKSYQRKKRIEDLLIFVIKIKHSFALEE